MVNTEREITSADLVSSYWEARDVAGSVEIAALTAEDVVTRNLASYALKGIREVIENTHSVLIRSGDKSALALIEQTERPYFY